MVLAIVLLLFALYLALLWSISYTRTGRRYLRRAYRRYLRHQRKYRIRQPWD